MSIRHLLLCANGEIFPPDPQGRSEISSWRMISYLCCDSGNIDASDANGVSAGNQTHSGLGLSKPRKVFIHV